MGKRYRRATRVQAGELQALSRDLRGIPDRDRHLAEFEARQKDLQRAGRKRPRRHDGDHDEQFGDLRLLMEA